MLASLQLCLVLVGFYPCNSTAALTNAPFYIPKSCQQGSITSNM